MPSIPSYILKMLIKKILRILKKIEELKNKFYKNIEIRKD